MVLERSSGLADTLPEPAGHAADGLQDLFFSEYLHLFPVDIISGPAVRCPQVEHVLASNILDGGLQHCRRPASETDFASNLPTERCFGRLAHQPQSLLDPVFRNKIQVR